MIRQDDLATAVTQGVIDQATADRLLAIAGTRTASRGARLADDEPFRLLGGFNDIFLSIGTILIAAAIFGLGSVLKMNSEFPLQLDASTMFHVLVAASGIAVMWLLAEAFQWRSPGRLPSLAAGALLTYFAWQFGGVLHNFVVASPVNTVVYFGMGPYLMAALLSGVLASLLFGGLFYWRFRLPFMMLPLSSAVSFGCFILLGIFVQRTTFNYVLAILLSLIIFSIAMRFDSSDRSRLTPRAAHGFWLHMSAAGLFVNGSILPLLMSTIDPSRHDWVGVLALMIGLVLVLGLIALAIDRRALLLSSLGYTLSAIAVVVERTLEQGHNISLVTLPTIALGGLIIVLLGLFWRPLRALVLAPVRGSRLLDYLPPVRT